MATVQIDVQPLVLGSRGERLQSRAGTAKAGMTSDKAGLTRTKDVRALWLRIIAQHSLASLHVRFRASHITPLKPVPAVNKL
jgi:hypothetical protein